MHDRQIKGYTAENFAVQYLENKGLQLITRNYQIPQGEIDIIMQQGESLIFVEVRFRETADLATIIESISPHKRSCLIKTATQ